MITTGFLKRTSIEGLSLLALAAALLGGNAKADPINWQSFQVNTLQATGGFGISFTTLPSDGRFILGQQQKLFVQNVFGAATATESATNGVTFDPSFVAAQSATSVLLGQGGSFGAISGLHPFDPSGIGGVGPALGTLLQTYAAAYWHSPTSLLEGWLVGGANGPSGPFSGHNITFVSLDGTKAGAVTEELCTFAAGMATDAGGNLYAALFELDGSPKQADADKVIRFSAAQLEPKIQAIMNGTPADDPLLRNSATFVHKFRSASSVTVDGLGRVWAAGFKTPDVEVYDPATGRRRVLVPSHGEITGAGGGPTYQVSAFTRADTPHISVLAYDAWMFSGTPVHFTQAPAAEVTLPADTTFFTWREQEFGEENLTVGTEETQWGENADPDGDGLRNVMEYALGTEPLTHEESPITTHRVEGLLRLSFLRNPQLTDATYTVQGSNTLASGEWTALASSVGGAMTIASGASEVVEADEGALKRVTVTDAASAAGQNWRFMRLRITLASP
jgi:hypothetical protein